MAFNTHDLSREFNQVLRNWALASDQADYQDGWLKRWSRKGACAALTKMVGLAIPFARRSGFEVVAVGPGYLKARIPFSLNKNHINTMYAGALFTLAELPGGILTLVNFSDEYYPLIKDLKMNYLKKATSDVTVEFRVSPEEMERLKREVLQNGKSNFLLKGELRDTSGEIVATSEGHYQMRSHSLR